MPVDFQDVRNQIIEWGENSPGFQKQFTDRLTQATEILYSHAENLDNLRKKVDRIVENHDKNLRCAIPMDEKLNSSFVLPEYPTKATIFAADGSQIKPNPHEALNYFLINVGAIQMLHGTSQPPKQFVKSDLYYDEALYTPDGTISEGMIDLIRDEGERSFLASLAKDAASPVITLTDGGIELWGNEQTYGFKEKFEKFLATLSKLNELGAVTAGYVDKPRNDLVVRLLEIAILEENEFDKAGKKREYRGITDRHLYKNILKPGERSPIFGIQSRTADKYKNDLALKFFYLNVGKDKSPWITRVEIPDWVVKNKTMLDNLHSILIYQCNILVNKPYPYILHRAHETALVSRKEKEHIDQMIAVEQRKRGIKVGIKSHKQFHKDGK